MQGILPFKISSKESIPDFEIREIFDQSHIANSAWKGRLENIFVRHKLGRNCFVHE